MPVTRDGCALRGAEVAFTGRLASMTRREAEEIVCAHGGRSISFPGRGTDYLVVGQDGWPIRRDGRVSRKLGKARALQKQGHAISLLTEEEFLEKMGFGEHREQIHRLYTLAQLTRILGVPRDRLRHWVRRGFVKPTKTVHRLAFFDFSQVASTKALWNLARAGVPLERIRRSLHQLQTWLPGMSNPLAQLHFLEHDRQILVRLADRRVADPGGQLYFSFMDFAPGVPESELLAIPPAPGSGENWFELGLRHEEEGRLEEAVKAYRQALLSSGPDPVVCFNLGNTLYALGRKEQAAERFLQAVELDPEYVEAWNNLGNAVADLGDWEEAVRAYRRALQVEPLYGDAHYNLAEALTQRGRPEEARQHWRAYLRLDPRSSWADHARERLQQQ